MSVNTCVERLLHANFVRQQVSRRIENATTTLGLKSTGRPKRLRKLPPMRIERHINQEEWHEETSRFGNILRGPQGVLIPENVFREIEQDMNRLLTSENKI